MTIRFAPTSQGDFTGSFDISSNDSDQGVLTATLTGKGRALAMSINRVVRVNDSTLQIIVTVRDQNDLPVTDLVLNDFTIVENNGSPIIPTDVSNTFTPGVSVGMVLDRSETMDPFTSLVQTAANSFIDLLDLANNDEAEIIKFQTDIDVKQSFTQDNVAIKNAINDNTLPWGNQDGTALFDALNNSIISLSSRSNLRRAIIAVYDGQENTSSSTAADVTGSATANNVQIFTIGIGIPVDNVTMQQLATDTGGQYFYNPGADDLTNIYTTISEILGNEYTITYSTSFGAVSTISINVEVDDNGSLPGGQLGETSKTVTL